MSKKPKGFDQAYEKAGNVVKQSEKLISLLINGMEKAAKNQPELRNIWDDLQSLFRMVSAYAKGNYKDISTTTIITATAAIVYLVNPFDVIPDFIPLLGLVDDAAVIAFVVNRIRKELDKYTSWERR